jgi:hypothetical protein
MMHLLAGVAIYVGVFVALAAVLYFFAYDRPRPATASSIYAFMVTLACIAAAMSTSFPAPRVWALVGGLVYPAWGITMSARGVRHPRLDARRLAMVGALLWSAYAALEKDPFVGGLAVGTWFTAALSYLMARAQAGVTTAAPPTTPTTPTTS